MFTRNGSVANKSPAERSLVTKLGSSAATRQDLKPGSVIGSDIKIVGSDLQISSEGSLQIDGEVEGEIYAKEVIIGETGKVTGTVSGDRVNVRGTVLGLVRGVAVMLQSTCHVEGDVHNNTIIIESGAQFDGRCSRFTDSSQFPKSPRTSISQ